MAKHLVRNFFGLLILYIIIIFGIFAIQFRQELSIFQNFQSLNLRLSGNSSQDGSEQTTLSNNFRASGNGIVIFASESNPVLLQNASGDTTPLVLQNWEQESENAFTLLFSNNVSLSFHADELGFDIRARIPNANDSLIIPYETEGAYNITEVLRNKIIVKSREKAFSMLAGNVTTNTLELSSRSNPIAQISLHEETKAFSFASIIGMANTTDLELDSAVTIARNHIVRAYETSQADRNNEKLVASYVAELALQGRYKEALANVPQSFIDGTNRTYFTAPYFNTLASMNQTLIRENENILFSMQYSLERSLLDVYKLDTFPSFLLQQNTTFITDILSLPGSMTNFEPTVEQAAGILDVYVVLSKTLPTSAALLEPVIEICIDVIQTSTTLTETTLSIIGDDGLNDKTFTAKVGSILKSYGSIASRPELEAGGTMFLISSLQDATLTNAITLAQMYPYIIADNPYYPHGDVLGYNNGSPIWMWNIVPEKDFSQDAEGNITLHLDFPVTEIYHSIITGIEPFEDIKIYGLIYATDFRFETYNAPGYVYEPDNKALLLRYRQRSEVEEMELIYTVIPEPEEGSTVEVEETSESI